LNFLSLKSLYNSQIIAFKIIILKIIIILFPRSFGWLIESNPPAEATMGATLEIQRAQQIEALEQQMIQQQVNQVNPTQTGSF